MKGVSCAGFPAAGRERSGGVLQQNTPEKRLVVISGSPLFPFPEF
jgi:hypothetical protein